MKLPAICPERECCCGKKGYTSGKGLPKIVLIGNPNVGKSSLFNVLSGSYTLVSNYPGTSVEITHGKARIGDREYEIIDTPGMYSLLPVSEEERVSQLLLFEENPSVYLLWQMPETSGACFPSPCSSLKPGFLLSLS